MNAFFLLFLQQDSCICPLIYTELLIYLLYEHFSSFSVFNIDPLNTLILSVFLIY